MPKPPGLLKRGSVFYYRARVPADVRRSFRSGKAEIKISLDTTDPREARSRCILKAAELEQQYATIRVRQPRALASSPRRIASLTRSEVVARVHRYVETTAVSHLQDFVSEPPWQDRQREERGIECAVSHAAYEDPSDIRTLQDIHSTERNLFGPDGLPDNLSDADKLHIRELIRQALLEIEGRDLNWLAHNRSGRRINPVFAKPLERPLSLSDVSQEYLVEYRKSNPTVGIKRRESLEKAVSLAVEFLGPETLVAHITAKHCREFRDCINELPSNFRKHFPDSSLGIKDILRRQRDRGLPTMKKNTQKTYIRGLKMLLKWAELEEYIPKNPARDLQALGQSTPAKEARDPFSLVQLQRIFAAPLYSGCENDKAGYATPGPEHPRRTRYWIPLIALFTGMRLNEICQLRVCDFKQTHQNNYFFDVNDEDGKRIKNDPSKRRVPVHPTLLKFGIADYIRQQREAGCQKVFPDIRISRHGYQSERMSRWFNEGFLRHLGIKTTKISFHSFRHTFKDALRAANTPIEVDDAICGWHTIKGSSTGYGKGYEVDHLMEFIGRVQYPGLDLSHLFKSE